MYQELISMGQQHAVFIPSRRLGKSAVLFETVMAIIRAGDTKVVLVSPGTPRNNHSCTVYPWPVRRA